ncbi:MAG: SRPBCC family protein [Gemmobacter sp.]|jgi:hypothetical protein|nr:SRPBCC family protein [Gemmobacter sp.]
MKLNARGDIEAPLEVVFTSFADTGYWEAAASHRGAEVTRTDRLHAVGPGMAWNVGFRFRGKRRQLSVKLIAMEPEQKMVFHVIGGSFDAFVTLDFMELSARHSRVNVATEVKPRNLAARVFIQSMRLARSKLERRYETRIGTLCHEVEERSRSRAGR